MKAFTGRHVLGVLSAVGLAAATLFTVGGLAQAGQEEGAAIKACVNKQTGDVRIPSLPKKGCTKDEQSLTWNVKGPRGPRGPEAPDDLPPAFETPQNTGTLPPNTQPALVVASLEGLPAGRYMATATLTASSVGPAPVPFFACNLQQAGGSSLASMSDSVGGEPVTGQSRHSSSSMTALVTVEANGGITASCIGSGRYVAKLVAVAVAPAAP